MPKIPEINSDIAEPEQKKVFAVSYKYQLRDGSLYTDTWNITERKNIGAALEAVDLFCSGNIDCGNWVAYEITNINRLQ